MTGVALSTTKRKFHKLLDSISNASNTSLVPEGNTKNASTTTLPSTFESPAKKARTVRPVSALVTATPRIARREVGAPSTRRNSTASAMSAGVQNPEPPSFAPWDRGHFLKRLGTYRHVDKWMGKPEKINEVEWAKRGWSCVGRDKVRCVGGCSHEVVIKLEDDPDETVQEEADVDEEERNDEDDWREKAQEQLIEKYVEKIIIGHSSGCLWRRRGCDDTIFRLPLYHQATTVSTLRQRYDSLTTMSSSLPTNLSTPPSFSLSEYQPEIASILQPSKPQSTPAPHSPAHNSSHPSSPTRPPPSPPLNHEAFILAMFGWQAETGHIPGLATCSSCFRRLGLWLFIPQTTPTGEEKEATMARLDVVSEHRDYCPWIDAVSQNGVAAVGSRPGTASSQGDMKDKAGWEVLAGVAANVVRVRRREQRAEKPAVVQTSRSEGQGDEVSVSSTFGTGTTAVERDGRDESEKDKERWARLKRIKQAFSTKKRKKEPFVARTGTGTA